MFELGFGKKVFVGIDIGTSAIKIVELKVAGGKPILSNYAWMSLGKLSGVDNDKLAHFDTLLPQYIKKMLKEAKIKGKETHVSLPAFGGLITLIDFPEMAEKDMEQAIRFEAQKYIPTSLDEVAMSWDIIGKSGETNTAKVIEKKEEADLDATDQSTEKNKVQVLLVAASRNKVEKYEKLIKSVGLKLKSIEIESFSMVRSLVGNDPGNFIIVDIGSRICNIILVEKGMIRGNRNIDAGGKDITRTIAKSMGMEEVGAERLKLSGQNFFKQESAVNLPSLDIISGEITRLVNSFHKGAAQADLDGIILSGGTANLAGIREYFAQSLGIKVISGNPFSRIGYNKKLEPVLGKIGPQFSVCIGLALKGAENYLK